MAIEARRWRLVLDTGVIIAGVTQRWGAAKAVLIIVAERDRYSVVLPEPVRAELDAFLANQSRRLSQPAHITLEREFHGWLSRVHLERWPQPTAMALSDAAGRLLPALRHLNDLPGAVAAEQARPDWIVSANAEHWNHELARRLGLPVVTPNGFLQLLRPWRELDAQ